MTPDPISSSPPRSRGSLIIAGIALDLDMQGPKDDARDVDFHSADLHGRFDAGASKRLTEFISAAIECEALDLARLVRLQGVWRE